LKNKNFRKRKETVSVTLNLKNPKDRTSGTSSTFDNTLARPLKKAINDGIFGEINYVMYEEYGEFAHTFGAFCYTPAPGNRLLFFPGISKRTLNWHRNTFGFKKFQLPPDILIDHFTLEKDFKTFHISIIDSRGNKKVKLENFEPKRYNNEVFFWFAISLNNTSILEPTPTELNLSFRAPKPDAARRKRNLEMAFAKAIPTVLTLPRNDALDKHEYLHFEVFFTRDKRNKIEKPPIENLPLKSTRLIYLDEKISNFLSEPILVPLEEFPGSIFVIVAKFKGDLGQDAIITSPEFTTRDKYSIFSRIH